MTRRAWILIVSGYALMAIGFIVVLLILNYELNRLDATQKTIEATQKQALQVQASLGAFVVHASGAICLVALAPTKDHERKVVESYLSGSFEITHYFGQECTDVAERAKADIFIRNGKPLPPQLSDNRIEENR